MPLCNPIFYYFNLAAFWATNPNNTYEGNAVAGCSHFGFWYRISGSARSAPLGKFFNNTVHSCGRYGLWIFPGYNPRVPGSREPDIAKFTDFTSYSCDKALEYVHANNIQLIRFKVWDHHTYAMETLKIDWLNNQNLYNEQKGPLIADSVVVGNSKNSATNTLAPGLVIAQDKGHLVSNVRFFNYPGNKPAIQSTDFAGIMPCPHDCGGYTTHFQRLKFDNVRFRANWDWNWQHVFLDRDGTLTGHTHATNTIYAVAKSAMTNSDPRCTDDGLFANGLTCSIATSTFIRYAFKWDTPSSKVIRFTDFNNKTSVTREQMVRLTYGNGMMVALESNSAYRVSVPSSAAPLNISYLVSFHLIL